jgi:hypothetical protein|tara:strand:+ start:76 stop:354 length:279 start_codon:yes stop_codon:yes gene_type:complete
MHKNAQSNKREEWASTSDVPQQLCKVISKQIIKFANKENLDREQELRELLNPLIDYAKGRGRKQGKNDAFVNALSKVETFVLIIRPYCVQTF